MGKSSKRKEKLIEYFEFCNQEYQKHVSCLWLSLERFIEGALKKIPSLKSYFLSENFEDARLRFKRVTEASSNPIMESVLLFHNTSIQSFTNFNQLLQRI